MIDVELLVDQEGRRVLANLMASEVVLPKVKKRVARGAMNIKKAWQKTWRGHPHIPALPYAINYDLREEPTAWEAEVGVDKSKNQGPLGNIVEFGSPGRPPMPGGAPALAGEAPGFERSLADIAVEHL